MLYWLLFLLSVLFGIDIGAELLGYGPQAYLGGLIAGAGFFLVGKGVPEPSQPAEEETDLPASPDENYLHTAPAEFRAAAAAHAGQASSRRKHRRRSTQAKASLLERLKDILQI